MNHPPRNIVIDWINTVWETSLPPSAKLVACCLRRYMNSKNDMAWPSVARITGECGFKSDRTTQEYLKLLCSEGWLGKVGASKSGTTIYQAQTPANIAPPQITTDTPANIAPELNKELNNTTTTKKKSFIRPTIEEIKAYAAEKKFTVDTDYFFEFYTTAKWLDAGGKQVKNWKLKLLTWDKREKSNGSTQRSTGQPVRQHKQTAADRLRAKLAEDIANGAAV